MLGDVINTRPYNAHCHIVPGHSTVFGFAQFILLPVIDVFEVHDAIVVEVLARPHFVNNPLRMNIREGMLMVVPTTKAQVQAADEGHRIVDDDEFLMMSPVERHICSIFKDIVIGVAHDLDIAVARRALGTEALKGMFCVLRVTGEGGLNFAVDDDVDFYACLGAAFQDGV